MLTLCPAVLGIRPRYLKTPWATPCLVVNNFMYNCHSNRGNRGYWRYIAHKIPKFVQQILIEFVFFDLIYRCHNYSKKKQEDRCRARCVLVNGCVKALTGGPHNHPPHTDKIDKIEKRQTNVTNTLEYWSFENLSDVELEDDIMTSLESKYE